MRILSKNKIFALIAIFFAIGVAWSFYGGSPGGKAKSKRLGKVKRGDLVQRVTVSGMIYPARRTIFVAPYDGYIRKIYVKIGQKIKMNEPVVSIASSLMSPEQVFPIRAPFAGTVVDIEKREGEYVGKDEQKNKTIVRVDDQDKFYVVAKAAELDASRVKIGMEVEIRINAFKHDQLRGIVREIDLAAQEADGWKEQQATFGIRVEILNPPPELRSGQSAIVDVVTGKYENVLYLEHEFINRDNKAGEPQDFVITAKGKRKNIKTGRQTDVAVEIVEGLSEGEEVEQIDFLKLLEGA